MRSSLVLCFLIALVKVHGQNVGIGTSDPTSALHSKGMVSMIEAFSFDLENGQLPPGEHSGSSRWSIDPTDGYKSTYSMVSPNALSENEPATYIIPYSLEAGRLVTFSFWMKKNDSSEEVELRMEWDQESFSTTASYVEWTEFSFSFESHSSSGLLRITAETRSKESSVKIKLDDLNMRYESGYALRVEDGTENNGYVLTSDALGNAKWTDIRSEVSDEISQNQQDLNYDHESHRLSIENGNTVNISGLRNDDFRKFYMMNDTLTSTTGFSLFLPKNGPQQPGFFWDQKKGSLLMGRDPINGNQDVGSFAMRWGLTNEVTAFNTTSFGSNNKSSAAGATSWGFNNEANGNRSTVWGEENVASGAVSSLWGFKNTTTDSLSTAWGSHNSAGRKATVWGEANTSEGLYSTAWGYGNRSFGILSTSWGIDNFVTDSLGTAWGRGNIVDKLATAIGINNNIGRYSIVLGSENNHAGLSGRNIILGHGNYQSASNSFALGWNNEIARDSSILIGRLNVPGWNRSTLIGIGLRTNGGVDEFSMGKYNYSSERTSSFGNVVQHLWSIGNGSVLNRENAIAVFSNSRIRLGYDGPELTNSLPSTVEIAAKPGVNSTVSFGMVSNNDSGSSMRFRSTASNIIEFKRSDSEFRMIHHSSGDYFRIHNDDDINPTSGLYVSSDNHIGINWSAPIYDLQLGFNSAAKPSSSSWIVASDRRLKKDIRPFSAGLETVLAINPVWFTYNGRADINEQTGVGTIAQELEQVAPYMVTGYDHRDSEGSATTYKAVDYGAMDFVLVNAIKEQNQLIKQQELTIEKQREALDLLNQRIERLESMITVTEK